MLDDEDYSISDRHFKVLIATSLPLSWDVFTDQYIGRRKGKPVVDPKKRYSSQQFIDIIKEEYLRHLACSQRNESTNQVTSSKCSLADRMGETQLGEHNTNRAGKPCCKHCNCCGHKVADCLYKKGIKCETCSKVGHFTKDCWSSNKNKSSANANASSSARPEEAHIVEEKRGEDLAFTTHANAHVLPVTTAQANITTHASTTEQANTTAQAVVTAQTTNTASAIITTMVDTIMKPAITTQVSGTIDQPTKSVEPATANVEHKDDDNELIDTLTNDEEDMREFYKTYGEIYRATDPNANDKRVYLYEWLADSTTTSHVANQREFFTEYQLQKGAPVGGVGNTTVVVVRRGTVVLESEYEGLTHSLRLQNVLHIPTNKNNLLSLGRWDMAGGEYRSKNSLLSMIIGTGKTVAIGHRVQNHLYKMQVSVRMVKGDAPQSGVHKTFATTEPLKSWETWHKRFGHVSYSGLKHLWEKNLVDSFNIDTHSPKPDCVMCTEAKQHEEPYGKSANRQTKPGELTHIDLWGKYDIASINRHQYSILFVGNATQYITTQFLKKKDEVMQAVKDYLTHLGAHSKPPSATCTDQGKEFINQELKSWCHE
jgi:hypothetical protein